MRRAPCTARLPKRRLELPAPRDCARRRPDRRTPEAAAVDKARMEAPWRARTPGLAVHGNVDGQHGDAATHTASTVVSSTSLIRRRAHGGPSPKTRRRRTHAAAPAARGALPEWPARLPGAHRTRGPRGRPAVPRTRVVPVCLTGRGEGDLEAHAAVDGQEIQHAPVPQTPSSSVTISVDLDAAGLHERSESARPVPT